MGKALRAESSLPSIRVDVHEAGKRARIGWLDCEIGEHLRFSTEELESYCFAQWEPVVFDALLVAAAIEFCDKTLKRPVHGWVREFELRIPVHEPDRWAQGKVNTALHEALSFLTGDEWNITFVRRKEPLHPPRQSHFILPVGSRAVIPFSEGLDSRAVAGLMAHKLGDKLIRVRLGAKASDGLGLARQGQPFTAVPYRVRQGDRPFVESSARSRGFKFALVSGLAAYLVKADQVIVPESGQGSLGPVLVPVGQAYEDYRNHPLFTDLMEKFLGALFDHYARFEFPRLWQTKGETLKEFIADCIDGHSWATTWSCWQQARHVSVDGRKRQCGICAACMLRRQSVHAAGFTEPKETYVWENLSARSLERGAANSFTRITGALREYAIAGTLHLDHLAGLRTSAVGAHVSALSAFQLSRSRSLPEADVQAKLDRLLVQHENEWRAFMNSLGKDSFVADWAAYIR